MFAKKDNDKTEVMPSGRNNRHVMRFRPASGDVNRWRGTLLVQMMGNLNPQPTRIPSDTLKERFATTDSALAWGRLRDELSSVTLAYCEACLSIDQASELISAAVAGGGDPSNYEKAQAEAIAERDKLARRRDALIAALPEAKAAATDVIKTLGEGADLTAMNDARAQWDADMAEVGAFLADKWAALQEADRVMHKCGGRSVTSSDVDRILGEAPDTTPTDELLATKPAGQQKWVLPHQPVPSA